MGADTRPLHTPANADLFPSAWAWSRLDDVCDAIIDCPHSTPALTEVGPFVARSQDIRTGVFRVETAAHVSEATYCERIARAAPGHGDLLYSREGTYFGIAAEVPENARVCLGQRMVLIRPRTSVVSSRFLKYWLNSPTVAAHVGGFRDGSVAERLNLPTIRGLPVVVPPLAEQVRIARILGALDDKIELNRSVSRTLESIARAIFKSWFVDFDPVHRKIQGGEAGLSPHLAPLFPDSLVDSALGRIPEGWTVVSVGQLAELAYGKALREGDRRPGIVPVYGSSGPIGSHDSALVQGPGIVIGRKGNPGTVTWSEASFFPIDTTFFVVAKRSRDDLLFLRFALDAIGLDGLAADSAVPGLNRNTATSVPILAPPVDLTARFAAHARSLTRAQYGFECQSLTLRNLRDQLMPRLIDGTVSIYEPSLREVGRCLSG